MVGFALAGARHYYKQGMCMKVLMLNTGPPGFKDVHALCMAIPFKDRTLTLATVATNNLNILFSPETKIKPDLMLSFPAHTHMQHFKLIYKYSIIMLPYFTQYFNELSENPIYHKNSFV